MAIEPGASIAAVLAALPLDPLENRILLCHATGLSRVQLITQGDRPLTADEAAQDTVLGLNVPQWSAVWFVLLSAGLVWVLARRAR